MSDSLTSLGRALSPWRHPFRFLLLVVVLSLLVWKLVFAKSSESAAYITAKVERGDIQNLVTATGILQPRNYVDVGAQVSGQLKKLYVAVGSEVKAGDLLAEIDATVYRAKVDGIRAQLLNQKAQLLDKQAQLTLAQIRFERQKNLQADDATTKESVQTAEANLRSAQAQLQSLEAQIKQTDSSLRAEEANLEYARIYAPITGTVVTLTSRQGQTLNTNQQAPTIMRIADLSTMTVQTQVSEADIGKLKIGMPVYFTTLGSADKRWYSKLDRVEPTPTVTNNVVLYNALFEVPNDNRVLMTQMSTQVFFITSAAKDILIIPAAAVDFVLDGAEVKDPAKQGSVKNDLAKKDAEQSTASGKITAPDKSSAATSAAASSEKISEKPAVASQTEKTGEPAGNAKRKRHRDQNPAVTGEPVSRPATVQVMDAKGKLSERSIVIGIGNRVHVQVIEGLSEGEMVVSGKKPLDKPAAAAASSNAAPGMGAAPGARMMR